jgi:hypothetical protein
MNTVNAGIGPATRNEKAARTNVTAVAGVGTAAGEASVGPEVGSRPTYPQPTTPPPG